MPQIDISEIVIGKRYRENANNITSLTESLRAIGLINPITVNSSYELIAGQKRVLAATSLGWTSIDARIVDAEIGSAEALQIEHDENEEREGWTPSEKVAIVRARRAAIGRKQGERSDLRSNDRKLIGETNEHLAKAVGFGSRKTLERAETVVEHGTPELINAMDEGTVSISDAASVAELPPKEQLKALRKKTSRKSPTLKAAAETRAERLTRLAEASKNGQAIDARSVKRKAEDALAALVRALNELHIYEQHRTTLALVLKAIREVHA